MRGWMAFGWVAVLGGAAWSGLAGAGGAPEQPFVDIESIHSTFYFRPVQVQGLGCVVQCGAFPVFGGHTGDDPDGDPAIGFLPGEHVFWGQVGYVQDDGNYVGTCLTSRLGPVVLEPVDGVLDHEVLVWRHHEDGVTVPDLPLFDTWGPGPVEPLRLAMHCYHDQPHFMVAVDALEWPTGNLGEPMVVRFEADVDLDRPDGALTPMRDVDAYPAWETRLV